VKDASISPKSVNDVAVVEASSLSFTKNCVPEVKSFNTTIEKLSGVPLVLYPITAISPAVNTVGASVILGLKFLKVAL